MKFASLIKISPTSFFPNQTIWIPFLLALDLLFSAAKTKLRLQNRTNHSKRITAGPRGSSSKFLSAWSSGLHFLESISCLSTGLNGPPDSHLSRTTTITPRTPPSQAIRQG
ncbi:hypothetical protein PtA15_13A27 [Puccinia triticina]|uniref:Uncharacterized protein n=1 Tax=Puccinia triticina TaxID=208348 RepID=A0ABY7CZ74_9BASI|nr:uncharacterized protein PtA15_13A27 [Puccinia triticina]WAQ90629.1 hypothetical protein PtA15_13A27 [Puccinia triticina]